jgi:hypothetical protein
MLEEKKYKSEQSEGDELFGCLWREITKED